MSIPRNQQEANEQGPDLHLQQNVIICDLKSRMPKTLRKQLRGKNVIYNDCTRYTDLCDEVVVMRMNELKHDIRNMYCEFYGVETDDELRECVNESISTGDEEFKELRKQIMEMVKVRFDNQHIITKFKNPKLPFQHDFNRLNISKTTINESIENIINTYSRASTIIILLTTPSVSKSIYHSLKSIKLPNEIMIISNENDGLCGQFCEFQVKIDDSTKSKFDVWTVSN